MITKALHFGRCLFVITLLALLPKLLAAQKPLPLIRATNNKVDIQDGEEFQRAIWNLSPVAKPDIYKVLKPETTRRVVFYTDIDSISFEVEPDKVYDFIILLNGVDTCYTQITTKLPPRYVRNATIDSNLLQEDFDEYRMLLEKYHAGLYRYTPKSQLNHLFDSCRATLNKPLHLLQFYTMLAFLTNAIRDGHTSSALQAAYRNEYGASEKMLPVRPFLVKDRAFVLCSASPKIPLDAELLSIDGIMLKQIIEKLLSYQTGDGYITTKRTWNLNAGAFLFFYNWVYGEKDSYFIRYKTADGKIAEERVNAVFADELNCADNGRQNKPIAELTFPNPNIAVLSIRSFQKGTNPALPTLLDEAFSQINQKKIKSLIIDVRNNAGGADEYGALLYSYLTDKPFRYFSGMQTNTHNFSPAEQWGLRELQPNANNYKGKLIVLINGLCFSTTADFCAVVKSSCRALFIGEETGGAYAGNTSGEIETATLPYSGIRLSIPKIKYMNAVVSPSKAGRGTIPDIEVLPSSAEYRAQKDVQMERALKEFLKTNR